LPVFEAAEADEVHRLALADGSFDPGEYAASDGESTAAVGCPASVATPSIKPPRCTTPHP
jgi:hypothetical protein